MIVVAPSHDHLDQPTGNKDVFALVEAGFASRVIDGTDAVSPYPDRADFLVQGLTLDEIVLRIDPDTDVVGISCMFSTLWPLTHRVAEAVREKFPKALLVLGGEHGTAVPDHVLATSPFDVVVFGEGEETFVELLRARAAGRPVSEVKGLAIRQDGRVVNTALSARRRAVDGIPRPAWDAFPIGEYIERHQTKGINLGAATSGTSRRSDSSRIASPGRSTTPTW